MPKEIPSDAQPLTPDQVNGVTEPAKPSPEDELSQTISVKPPALKKTSTGMEIAKRTALLAVISAAVAALVKKTVYPFMVQHQPENFPVRVPDEVGFFAGGVMGATGFLLIQKKLTDKQMSRRDFFPILGAGIGAAIGGTVTQPKRVPETVEKGE